MQDTTPRPDPRTEAQISLARALQQLEVAERNAVPGLEEYRRRVHDLQHGRSETFRNAGLRVS